VQDVFMCLATSKISSGSIPPFSVRSGAVFQLTSLRTWIQLNQRGSPLVLTCMKTPIGLARVEQALSSMFASFRVSSKIKTKMSA
jgi:hypothetical protein